MSEKIGKMVGERFGKSVKHVVPPQMFLIIDASKTESPVYICCLVMWEVPPGCVLRKKNRETHCSRFLGIQSKIGG